MPKIFIVPIVLAALAAFVWAGLSVQPRPFEPPLEAGGPQATVPVPQGLPAPVERFYRAAFGDRVPVVESVVYTGRGRMRPFGIWLPARFVIAHRAGRDYRHYFEATFFGLPFLRVDEGYVDGKSFFESPMGRLHDDPHTNQGANLALWAEAGWFPSLWITDPRARWQAVDDATALLYVPFGEAEETFVVRFDPASGLVDFMESMRYRESGEGKPKILWITRNERTAGRDGSPIATGSATWMDQGKPWAFFGLERAAYGADVDAYLRKRGH